MRWDDSDDEEHTSIHDREIERALLEYGFLFFDQPITPASAAEFLKRLQLLELFWEVRSEKDFVVCYVSSPGGDVNAMLAMHDAITNASIPLVGVGMGEVASAAVCLLASFPRRFAYPNTRFLLHKMEASNLGGNPEQVESVSQEIAYLNAVLVRLLAKQTFQKEKVIRQLIERESYFGVDEAIKLGIIHGIVVREGAKDAGASSSRVRTRATGEKHRGDRSHLQPQEKKREKPPARTGR
jgi:ATP-dependent Clp protease protease subunit